jgi:hypothetical protein
VEQQLATVCSTGDQLRHEALKAIGIAAAQPLRSGARGRFSLEERDAGRCRYVVSLVSVV